MVLLSWDVGVIHLAYCILDDNYSVLDVDNINLLEKPMDISICCGKLKNQSACSNKAQYRLNLPNGETKTFCKTHHKESSKYWSNVNTAALFGIIEDNQICCYLQKNEIRCKRKAKYHYQKKKYYCTTHYKSMLAILERKYSTQIIKKRRVSKIPTAELQLILIKRLDSLISHFAQLGVDSVIIENQPAKKNAKMKSIASSIYTYYVIRGMVDNKEGLQLKFVRYISPSNKLRVNNQNSLEILRGCGAKKYKLTKQLSIQYTKQLLSKDPAIWDLFVHLDKLDDPCDAYLQGIYYLQFLS